MATSGSIDFNLNARAVIKSALERLGVYTPTEEPNAVDAQSCMRELNLMLKAWQTKVPNLWRRSTGTVTLVVSATSYTLSPRPFRVVSARYRNSTGRDLPLMEWTAEDYEDMPVKTSTGIPTAFYVDYQRDAVTMYVWQPMAAVSGDTIRYTYQRRFEDIDALENDIDIPQENLDLVSYSLAERIGPLFGRVGTDAHSYVSAKAAEMLMFAQAADREGFVRFEPWRP